MTQINSGARPIAVTFRQKEPRSSMAIMLTDYSPDASWRLRVEVETSDGGYFVLGAVDTIAPNALRIKSPNRVVALAAIPGAIQWHVFAQLLAGTPAKNATNVFAEMKLCSAEEYGGSCCPLVAIPGNATNVNLDPSGGGIGVGQQTPTGAPPIGTSILLFTGAGSALAADVAYLGAASAYVQVHDRGFSSAPVSTATMLGIGYPVDVIVAQTILLRWPEGRRFVDGFKVALSTTQNTFTASAETISAFGKWTTP